MKYAPLIWSALWRKPTEAVLTWLTVTAAFALFGLMLGVNATLQASIDSAPPDIVSVFTRFPSIRLQSGMREQIARLEGVSDIAMYYGLSGHRVDLRNRVRIFAVDDGAPRAILQFKLQPAHWQRLFAKPDGLLVSRKAAGRLVANGIAQSVRERAPELAMLRALGFRNGHLMGLVACEAAMPCLAGAVLGMLLAIQLARWPAKFLPGDFDSLPLPTISSSVMLEAAGFAALLACASSVIPLVRIARASVVSQLRNAGR